MDWKSKIKELFGIDIRSLALMRIGLALVLLGDLLIRLTDLSAHYTDDGVLPRNVVIESLDAWNISLHLISGTWEVQLLFFIVQILFAFALLVGYKTRLTTVVSWILLVSLQWRNPLVLQGGDVVIRLLLFWGMFLPLGAYWSVDRQLSKEPPPESPIFSAATAALLLQVCFIYWFAALIKTDPVWRVDGTAILYSLKIEQFTTPFGFYLMEYPGLLKVLTFTTFYLEAFGPFFAFSPIWTGPLRFATALAFIFFHLVGLNLAMELGVFCYICTVAWFAFFPAWFWDRVVGPLRASAVEWKASVFSNIAAVFFLVYILLWNVSMLKVPIPYVFPQLDAVASVTGVSQYWNMFSPYPLKEDGWYVIPGKLFDGTEVDLFTGKPVNWEKPRYLSKVYPNDRWRSFMMNLFLQEQPEPFLRAYANYLCTQWNDTHSRGKQLKSFEIVYMLHFIDLSDDPPEYEKTVLWEEKCF